MGCFWSGEACLARARGVISTRTGFVEGHEVVEVQYAEAEIDRAALEACGDPTPR
jgi:peptide methionine sulfoxide reductase MsrA